MELTLAEAHTLFASNRDLINSTWHFFVSIHLGLFAVALFSPSQHGSHRQLILLLPFYLGFMYLNYQAQLDNYVYGDELLTYIRSLGGSSEARMLSAVFRKGWVLQYLTPIYAGTAIFSVGVVLVLALQRERAKA